MYVAGLTIEYDGKAWYAVCQTDNRVHRLGLSRFRNVRVVVGPAEGHLDVASAVQLRDALTDLIVDLVSHLTDDLVDGRHDEDLGLFDPLSPGELAP